MKVLSPEQMRQLDEIAIEKYKIPSIVLMENAAISVKEEILNLDKSFYRIIILCGVGNNGGDGFALARHLINEGFSVLVFTVGDIKKISEDALVNYNILKSLEVSIKNINDVSGINHLSKIIQGNDLIVDALLGTGLTGEVRPLMTKVIEAINSSKNYVISVDIPSGVNGNTGDINGIALQADKTVTLFLPKYGNILYPGASKNGELIIKSIGVRQSIVQDLNIKNEIIDHEMVKQLLPKRLSNSHKGTFGTAHIIAGSVGMTGAAILTCRAALRAGLGLLKLYIPESINSIISTNLPEVITVSLSESRKGVIGLNNIPNILEDIKKADVISIGPGSGTSNELYEIINKIILNSEVPLVIDADGLNAISKNIELLKEKKSPAILTPHPGEMSRLIDKPIEEIEKNRVSIVREFAQEYDVYLVLKGARTIIGSPHGDILINVSGNSGMATAGMGDILTGIITSLVAQGVPLLDATILGVYIHGYTGDIMSKRKGEYSLIASDIVEGISQVFKELSK